MKTIIRAAALAATFNAFVSASTAFAAGAQSTSVTGHYEWQSQPSFGPRSPTRAPVRVWVSEGMTMADCDCAMMLGSSRQASACMAMPMKRRAASNG